MSQHDYENGFYDCKRMILEVLKGFAEGVFPGLPIEEVPFFKMIESVELKKKEVEQ